MIPVPIIMPRSSKYGNNYWNSDGPKVDMREVTLYSDLEFDHWALVETTPEVETYCEQYPEISFLYNGELHTSIFDMWVKFRNGIVKCCEIKYESELNPEDPRNNRTMRQIEAQRIWCEENGIEYEIVTDKALRRSQYELENRLKIISLVKNTPEPSSTSQLTIQIGAERISLSTLTKQTNMPYQLIHDSCLWLFYRGIINANIDESIICMQTEVWLHESYKDF